MEEKKSFAQNLIFIFLGFSIPIKNAKRRNATKSSQVVNQLLFKSLAASIKSVEISDVMRNNSQLNLFGITDDNKYLALCKHDCEKHPNNYHNH